jgi:gluconate 2-dehydrogenase gamma chain
MADRISRKNFVSLVGIVAAAETLVEAVTAPSAEAADAKKPKHVPAPEPPLTSEPEAYTFFTEPEWKFTQAAVERLIPTDELGPGALQAGVAFYIDQQLAGAYGLASKMYRQGPWNADASPDFGYQLRLMPQQVYRLGIAAVNAYCLSTYQKTFDALSPAHQDDVLALLDGAKLSFDDVPAKTFFEMLYANTVEGFFADPLYGGNRNKIGWKLIGFPGAAAAYISFIELHNVAYNVAPVGIADLQQQETAMVEMDGEMDEMQMHTEIAREALGVK